MNFKGRRLTTGFSHVYLGEEDSFRTLQETTTPEGSELGDSLFATNISLLRDSADVDGLPAPAFTASLPLLLTMVDGLSFLLWMLLL